MYFNQDFFYRSLIVQLTLFSSSTIKHRQQAFVTIQFEGTEFRYVAL